jgi:hypothetical protein
MKKAAKLSVLVMTLCGLGWSVSAMTPSSLSDCMAVGWRLKRITQAWSFSFMPVMAMPSQCFAEFAISPTDPKIENGWRAEIEDPFRPMEGEEAEYEFVTQIPASTLDVMPRGTLVTAQWHDNKKLGEKAQRPPLSHRLQPDGTLIIALWNSAIHRDQGDNGNGLTLFSSMVPKDAWLMFRYQIRWSDNAMGRVKAWLNDYQIIDYSGAIGYAGDPTGPYLKLGAYTVHPFGAPLMVRHAGYRRSGPGGLP